MQYRNEVKHIINPSDKAALCAALGAVMRRDPHAGPTGQYRIRSLYFDNVYDRALREKLDGVCDREKFRIRYYNGDTSFIQLEKKVKHGDKGFKVSAPITREEVQRLLRGDISWMPGSGRALAVELYSKMRAQGLRPKTIVEYTRTPFVCRAGNVRVTIDERLRAGLSCRDFLEADCVTLPAGEDAMILEVKWDGFLPAPVRRAVQLRSRKSSAFSKYAACRVYG